MDTSSEHSNNDNEIKQKNGLICANVKVRINTVGFITFNTIMRMDDFLICLNPTNNKMSIGNEKAVGTYKSQGIEATLNLK